MEVKDAKPSAGHNIIRRDFLRGALLGSGSMLLSCRPPAEAQALVAPVQFPLPGARDANDWNGYGGVGDYAPSHGNMIAVRETAHLIRDGKVEAMLGSAIDTKEQYDVIVIGGGFSGLGAVRALHKAKPDLRILVLENHPIPGGEAKRNEFVVNGHKIMGPQGSNLVSVPTVKGDWYDDLWTDLGIPRVPAFQPLTGYEGDLRISRENYFAMLGVSDDIPSAGYFFDAKTFGGTSHWDKDSRHSGYANTAFSPKVKADLHRLIIAGDGKNTAGENYEKWLDSITYEDYLVNTLGVDPATVRLLDAPLTVEGGLGADCVSALFALKVGGRGFDKDFPVKSLYTSTATRPEDMGAFSFPGGNDAVFRLLLKKVMPDAIGGGTAFDEVHNGPYRLDTFDRPGQALRIRLGSTAAWVKHEGPPSSPTGVEVVYGHDHALYRVRAKAVVSAMGGWVNKHVVQDLPDTYKAAFDQLVYGSCMIVNVALTNWEFMAKLGISAAHFFMEGRLGQVCNIRQPMIYGGTTPPLDPKDPIVLTFYVGFPSPGLPAKDQAAKARWELVSKSYKEIEDQIIAQMVEMFSASGFDPSKDVAGIVLNRWGHSYVVPTPGFYHGLDGKSAPSEVIKQRFGRIAFGHSELNGIQEWFGGVENGERAAQQILEVI